MLIINDYQVTLKQIAPDCTFCIADTSGSQFRQTDLCSDDNMTKRRKKKKGKKDSDNRFSDRASLIEEINKKSNIPLSVKIFLIWFLFTFIFSITLYSVDYNLKMNSLTSYYEAYKCLNISSSFPYLIMSMRFRIRTNIEAQLYF